MNTNYEIEYQKIREDFIREAEIAFKKSDEMYDEIVKKMGHENFLTDGIIDKPLAECFKKYQEKLQELRNKYNK